jgi:small subunit ribosomal protein S20
VANTASAIKRVRSNERKRTRNRITRTNTRTAVRSAREGIASGQAEDARQATLAAISALDKAAVKGVIHKNNASRRKSRLMKQLAALDKK